MILRILACSTSAPGLLPVVPPVELAFEAAPDAFDGDRPYSLADLFGVVVADLEGDGDLDLLMSRHLFAPLELFENQGDGRFVQLNRKGADRTGLYDNPGVPDLFADDVPSDAPGVYVWHETWRGGGWRLRIVPDVPRTVSLRVTTNTPIRESTGYLADEVVEYQRLVLALAIAADGVRDLTLAVDNIATELVVALDDPDPLPIRVGATGAVFEREAVLWKPDPHGIAWVDAVGDAAPDLFVSRGALIGSLAPPFDPKVDQLFEHVDGETTFVQSPFSHASYARGRQVMWIDLDADGTDELYVGNATSADQVLDPDAGFVDVAPALGLDLVEPDSFAWLDVDRDGRLDLVHADGHTLGVVFARGDRFEGDGDDHGLGSGAPSDEIFDPVWFRTSDVDRDGDLDLWVVDGDTATVRLLRAEGDGFVDATADVGLAGNDGFGEIVVLDADNDGWMDAIAAAEELVLWHNRRGVFERVPLGVEATAYAAGADVDGDGLTDVVYLSKIGRGLIRNATRFTEPPLELTPDAPLGTVVLGTYRSGDVLAQSWGQSQVTRYHQGLVPLRFGSTAWDPLVSVALLCPGQTAPTADCR